LRFAAFTLAWLGAATSPAAGSAADSVSGVFAQGGADYAGAAGGDEATWRLLWLCPMPAPLPAAYTVDRAFWSLWDKFQVSESDGTPLGSSARTLFSSAREMLLTTATGDPWAAARMGAFSRDLDFFDCVGGKLATLRADWSWLGGTPACDVLDTSGATIGRIAFDETLSSGSTTVMAVDSAYGEHLAQIIQTRSWSAIETHVHILVSPDRQRPNSTANVDPRLSPVDPTIDARVLALYSAMRFGASALFAGGAAIDVAAILVALLFACVAFRAGSAVYQYFTERRAEELRRKQRTKEAMALVAEDNERALQDQDADDESRWWWLGWLGFDRKCCKVGSGLPRPCVPSEGYGGLGAGKE